MLVKVTLLALTPYWGNIYVDSPFWEATKAGDFSFGEIIFNTSKIGTIRLHHNVCLTFIDFDVYPQGKLLGFIKQEPIEVPKVVRKLFCSFCEVTLEDGEKIRISLEDYERVRTASSC